MSFYAMAWAAKQKTGSAGKKLVLLLLADRANEDGYCHPSLSKIAEDAELSKKTVIKYIKELEAEGILSIEHRSRDGVSLSNRYRLNMSEEGVPNRGVVVEELHQGGVTATPGGSVAATPKPISLEPINEPKRKREKKKVAKIEEIASEFRVPPEILDDFIAYRKEIGHPVKTSQPVKAFAREIAAIGRRYVIDEAIALMKEREWRTLKLDWYERELNDGTPRGSGREPEVGSLGWLMQQQVGGDDAVDVEVEQ